MGRLIGLLLILRALAPVLIVLIIGGTVAVVLGDVQAAVDPPLTVIRTEMAEVRDTVEAAGENIEAVSDEVTDLVSVLGSFNLQIVIPNIPANLSFPSLDLPSVNIPVPSVSMRTTTTTIAGVSITYPSGLNIGSTTFSLNIPNIPSFSVPLPGLSQLDNDLRAALSGVTGVFDTFDAVFDSVGDLVGTLGQVTDHVSAITEQTDQMTQSLRRVMGRWQATLMIAVLAVLGLVLLYFGVPILDDFRRGWRMLRGLSASGV
ncbi:MAG: hypothetical protein CL610_21230 [Anaerolineaceae bacterium]|nr:hypothetical protein [Anaerolineaceae bacterium]